MPPLWQMAGAAASASERVVPLSDSSLDLSHEYQYAMDQSSDPSQYPETSSTLQLHESSTEAWSETFKDPDDAAEIMQAEQFSTDGGERTHESLDAYRTLIRQLYVRENRTLDDVITIMQRDHNVQAS